MATGHGSLLVDPASPETSAHVRLHPLVLIAQDDHATRSTVREQGPIVGAILGRNDGREVSMELAFECGSKKLVQKDGQPLLDKEWFESMLKHC
jgi:COP9 signalosome complex subunit 6